MSRAPTLALMLYVSARMWLYRAESLEIGSARSLDMLTALRRDITRLAADG